MGPQQQEHVQANCRSFAFGVTGERRGNTGWACWRLEVSVAPRKKGQEGALVPSFPGPRPLVSAAEGSQVELAYRKKVIKSQGHLSE